MNAARAMGAARAGVGVALLALPGAPSRLVGRGAPDPTGILLMRTIGIRDLVLGSGVLWSSQEPTTSEARRWALAALASDALDAIISAASARSLGRRDAYGAAALAMVFVFGDVAVLGQAFVTESHD